MCCARLSIAPTDWQKRPKSSTKSWKAAALRRSEVYDLACHAQLFRLDAASRNREEAVWVVNEGEYCMMNTLDLAVDHVFWELDHNPWLVKNLLDNFVKLYSYTDQIKIYKGEARPCPQHRPRSPSPPPPPDAAMLSRPYDTKPGGLSFCHDMGAHNNFAPKGRSSYELANLTSTFSYMTVEQLCNWTLTAACYMAKTRDTAWLRKNKKVVQDCLDQHDPSRRRCRFRAIRQHEDRGRSGNHHLQLARPFAGADAQQRLHGGQELGELSRPGVDVPRSRRQEEPRAVPAACEKVAGVVSEQAVDGIFPAIFEKENPGYNSRILPAMEGCVYPLYFARPAMPA